MVWQNIINNHFKDYFKFKIVYQWINFYKIQKYWGLILFLHQQYRKMLMVNSCNILAKIYSCKQISNTTIINKQVCLECHGIKIKIKIKGML